MGEEHGHLFYGDALCSKNQQYMFGMTYDGYLALFQVSSSAAVTRPWMEMMWKVGPFISSPNQMVSKFHRNGALAVKNQQDKTQPDYKILWHNGVDGDSKYTL